MSWKTQIVSEVKRASAVLAALLIGTFLVVSAAHAQTSKGTLTGAVRDASGAVIPSATVKVVNEETSETRETVTNGEGVYRIEAISPGSYSVHAEAAGFQTTDAKGVRVNPSVVTTYEPVLAVGSAATTVEVQANTNAINTDNGQLSGTINSSELRDLPIFSLNPIELVSTLPGVQLVNNQLNLGGVEGNGFSIEVNGARPRANNFMMDGQDINDVGLGGQAFQPQIPDMFQSETALTNSSSAEYGRSGGAVVNLITKSGTNKYHGSAWELYTGSGLNALDGISRHLVQQADGTLRRSPKARYDQHIYGFTAGGPIVRDKLFAFGGVQWQKFYGNATSTAIELPDAAGYATLTSIGGPNVALLQGLLNQGSYLTAYSLTGTGPDINVGTLNGCPATGCVVTTGLFLRPPVPQKQPDTQYVARADYNLRQADVISVRYLHDYSIFTPDLSLNTSGLPGFDGFAGGPSELGLVGWTHVFSPKLLNEFRSSLTRISFFFQATPQSLANPLAKNYTLNFTDSAIPALGLSQNIPQGRAENFYQFQDSISWTIGRQSLRIGADIGRILETDLVAQSSLGDLNISKGGTLNAPPGGTQTGLGNFLSDHLGPSGSADRTFGPTRIDPHIWRSAFYVQDDVKMTPELTFNVGLRWDYLTDPGNSLPYPGIDANNPFAPITTVYKIRNTKSNFGPRFGFAYAPKGSGWLMGNNTVFHGGAGIFYDTDFSNVPVNTAQASPNASSTTLTSTSTQDPSGLGDALNLVASIQPGPISPFSSVFSADKNLVNPSTYQWNLGIERELPWQLKMTANYVGTRGRKLYANQHLNYFDFNTGNRLNPDRGAIDIRENSAASQYDSVQTEISRQFSHGLFFRGAYTFGKNLDDGSEVFSTFASPTSYSSDLSPGGRRRDWGPSAFNFPHFLSVTYAWTPAGFHASNRGADFLLSGATRNWTVSGVTQLQSGPPTTFNLGGLDTNGDGSAFNDRPIVGNKKAPLNTAGIDTIYLGAPTTGSYVDYGQLNSAGNVVPVTPDQVHWLIPYGPEFVGQEVGHNSFKNPGTTLWNVALQKELPAPWTHMEGAAFQLRAEATDVGNHNDLNTLDTNILDIGTSAYMNKLVTRATTARNLRFWAKFVF